MALTAHPARHNDCIPHVSVASDYVACVKCAFLWRNDFINFVTQWLFVWSRTHSIVRSLFCSSICFLINLYPLKGHAVQEAYIYTVIICFNYGKLIWNLKLSFYLHDHFLWWLHTLLHTSFCLPYVFINRSITITIIAVANIAANWIIPVDVYKCMTYGSQVYCQCSTTMATNYKLLVSRPGETMKSMRAGGYYYYYYLEYYYCTIQH